jgi:uncharacterized membrane protein
MKLEFEHPWFLLLLIVVPLALLVLRYTLVDSPKLQLACSAATRCCILLLLVLSLSGALWVSRSDRLSLMILADLSDSVAASATNQLTDFLGKVQAQLPPKAQAGLMSFATQNEILTALAARPVFPVNLEKPKERSDTALERVLVTAWQGMPSDTVNRVVVFSDGNETIGHGLAAAKRASAHGLKVFSYPYQSDRKDEVLLEDLLVPAEVKKGQSFTVSATAHSAVETSATFTLYRDGFKVQETPIQLKPGANTLAFQESKAKEGLTKYELRVRADKDFFADNNVSSGIVHISGEPRVLLLERTERDARFLARALEAENIRVEVREGKGMPGSLEELASYDAILFSDVPATDLSVRHMTLLRSYVEDLGGGFIMIGGQESFGLGGYYRTSIEDALPVRMRSEKKKDTPSLAMMLVIDKSGSMSGQKMDLAKEAAIAAVEVLTDRDYVGVVAFDGDPYTVSDLQSAGNRLGIVQSIESIEAGGGTSIYPGLEAAHEALQGVQATFKHVILLTDGVSQPGDFQGIVETMGGESITVSAVAVGDDSDQDLLQQISRWGKGRYYFTTDPSDIPQIFTKETMTAAKSSLVEEPFMPQVYRDSQAVRSIDWDSAPFLFGYVITSAKPTAHVSLLTERGDPLLASWQFGLGKCAAFTSDAKSRWAADWVRWPGFGQFWAQLVRETMRSSQNRGAETLIRVRGDRGRIVVDNADDTGQFINGLKSTVQLIKPDLSIETLPLLQTAPGRYESTFPVAETGSYLFKVRQAVTKSDGTGEDVFSDFTRGLTISYKPEYRHLSNNEEYLKQLAQVTGGKSQPTVEELLRVEPGEAVPVRKRLWPWLLGAALVLFVLDVALRRLDLAGRGLFKPEPQRYG